MQITIESISPKVAEAWLSSNKSNRQMRSGVAERYAKDMTSGGWTECPEPISFYADGDVADGQHRLWAIIESGTTQTFPVLRGLSRAAGLNINTGLNRSIVDNARISGTDDGLNNTLISAANAIHHGSCVRDKQSASTAVKVVAEHREAAEFACRHVKRVRLLCGSVVLGAVGRAWYHEPDKDKLVRFCDVLGTGFYDGNGETAAISMRNYLLTKGSLASSSALWRDTFLKTQMAIHNFVRGRKIGVIKGVAEDAYPLGKRKAVKK